MENNSIDNSEDLLGLVGLGEASVRNFYRACAAQWPEEADYWQGLAAEEDGHCRMVARMLELVKTAPEKYSLGGPFVPEAYRSFIDWVVSMGKGVANGTLTKEEAVKVSLSIESTILESQIQKLIVTSEPEYLRLIGQIVDQTKRHSIMVTARASGIIKTGTGR